MTLPRQWPGVCGAVWTRHDPHRITRRYARGETLAVRGCGTWMTERGHSLLCVAPDYVGEAGTP